MNASRFIALRLSSKSRIATVSVAVSFLVMSLALMISQGFKHEVRRSVTAMSGDMVILSPHMDMASEEYSVSLDARLKESLETLPGVSEVAPVVYRAGVAKGADAISGALFKGVDSSYDFSFLLPVLSQGAFPDYASGGISAEVLLPEQIASQLMLSAGDSFNAYFIGKDVKARKFRIAGIYDAVVADKDGSFIFADIRNLRRVNGWDETCSSAYEIKLCDDKAKDVVAMTLLENPDLISSYIVQDVTARYPAIFNWLGILDYNLYAVLLLMFIVAGFNMVSGLLIILFENISLIGMLKTLGMRNSGILKIFLHRGSRIVFAGMLAGNAIAALLGFIQYRYKVIGLDPKNYILSTVPIEFPLSDLILLNAGAYIMIMLLLLIPSVFISKVDPAKTVKML